MGEGDVTHYFGYWSASPYAGNAAGAWVVGFGVGDVGNDYRSDYYLVRLVR